MSAGRKAHSQAHSWIPKVTSVDRGQRPLCSGRCIWVLSMWLQDHTAPHRFLQHAAGQGTGAGVILHGAKAGNGHCRDPGYRTDIRSRSVTCSTRPFRLRPALAISLLASGLIVADGLSWAPTSRAIPGLLAAMRMAAFGVAEFSSRRFPQPDKPTSDCRMRCAGRAVDRRVPLASVLRGSLTPLVLILIAFVFMAPWVGLGVLQTVDARGSITPSERRLSGCVLSSSNAG